MPCHPARARELMKAGKAVARHLKGLFYIQLTEREDGELQPIACGIDPGSKREGYTVKSKAHTFLNIQAEAVQHVSIRIKTRRQMRRHRRYRKTPCRQNRLNRARGGLPPSTFARWNWKLRLCKWLKMLYPISMFIVEDIKARTKGQRNWDRSFSPLEIGKRWFYEKMRQLGHLELRFGWQTKLLRDEHGLSKSKNKLRADWHAHAVDAFVLASEQVGSFVPDNKALLVISPFRFHHRQLQALQPAKGGIRRPYGGTRSYSFNRGSLVRHIKHGLTYVGGCSRGRITLHALDTGRKLSQHAKPTDCIFLAFLSWRCLMAF
jgi:hypothetical protein